MTDKDMQSAGSPGHSMDATIASKTQPLQRAGNRRKTLLLLIVIVLVIAGSATLAIRNLAIEHDRQIRVEATTTTRQHTRATETAIIGATGTAFTAPTATVIARYPDLYLPSEGARLLFYDPLTEPGQWNSFDPKSGSCRFVNNAYHVLDNQFTCPAANLTISNFAFEVQMQLVTRECGDIFFRYSSTNNQGYAFILCEDKTFGLELWDGKTARYPIGLMSSLIKGGVKQTNTLAIVAKDAAITLYINHIKVYSITDSTYGSGTIAFAADSEVDKGAVDVIFSEAKVWEL